MRRVPEDRADHPQTEQAHRGPLGERRHGAIAQCHADHEQADPVVCRIAEKIEGVCLQRRRSGREARANLDEEHDGVDREHSPEHAAIGRLPAMRVGHIAMIAAIRAHESPQ
jgi:hypothetical protein